LGLINKMMFSLNKKKQQKGLVCGVYPEYRARLD